MDKIYDPERKVEVVSYNMERFATDCVNVFCELSGFDKAKVGTAPTPFIDEANDPLVAFRDLDAVTPSPGGSGKGKKKKKKVESVIPPPGGTTAGTGKLSTIAVKGLDEDHVHCAVCTT